ncbi:MAG: hypothetical protein KatS3mg124_0809 [Porticoccaceae bacterium]|nr:MAG: hypothetical protein KatS3mg124_0809 [Porticoccaceae bacterium]
MRAEKGLAGWWCIFLSALCFALPGTALAGTALADPPPTPDLVLVKKSERKLYLLRDGEVLREYPVALGKNPRGHKVEEGDGRTPEGRYVLDWRNPQSKFYRAIHISYPNELDLLWANDRRKPAGGDIMIHGLPEWVPSDEWAEQWLQKDDWTDGCIAVLNRHMDEIWRLVPDGTPIEIWP